MKLGVLFSLASANSTAESSAHAALNNASPGALKLQSAYVKIQALLAEIENERPQMKSSEESSPQVSARFLSVGNNEEAQSAHSAFNEASEKAAKLQEKYNKKKSMDRLKGVLAMARMSPTNGEDFCPSKMSVSDCPAVADQRYATFDGSCNNRIDPTRGQSHRPLKRLLEANYDDGQETIRKSVKGSELPAARVVSNKIQNSQAEKSVDLTHMFTQWGQFIIHDIVHTPVVKGTDGNELDCNCADPHPECINLPLGEDDIQFLSEGKTCHSLERSLPTPDKNCNVHTREQLNQISSYIDGTTVYGTSAELAESIRDPESDAGELKADKPASPEHGEFEQLPKFEIFEDNPPKGFACPFKLAKGKSNCFLAGDTRINENLGLASMHTLFMREHNRIARELKRLNPQWSSDTVFHETRLIIAAMHQIITYNEYLPAMLGQTYTKRYNLDLANSGYFYGYDASVDASVANEFTTAAFRFGHSMIFDQLSRPSNDWTDEQSPLELKAFVFNPLEYVNQNGSQVEPVLRGLVVDPSLMADTTFPSSMKEFLFAEADKYGKDLLAINIQRGRDHGLRGYNDYREFFGLQRAADFDELLEIPADMRHSLSGLYEHVDDIDLYVGGLAETPVSGGTVGPTFAHMMAAQFRDLKVGDRFYFENGGCETTFTPEQLTELRKITLSSLICTCTDTVEIQQMPFYFATEDSESSPNRNANPRIPCSEIGNLDLSAWQQPYRNADELEGIPDSGVWTAWVPAYGNPPSLDLDVLHRERPTGVCLNAIGAEMRILETGDPQMRFMCPAGAISHSDVPPACLERGRWTNWIDSSNPTTGTDSELLKDLRKLRAAEICEHPINIQAQTVEDNTPAGETGDVFATLDPVRGLLCRGEDQVGGACRDYKVRFFCPPDDLDFDLEMEIALAYQTESRKVITSIANLIDEEVELFSFDDFAWTGWYNSDSPSLDDALHGDNESLMRARATAEICASPVAIEAVRALDGVDALSTGDVFKFFSPKKGLLCEDSDQTSGYKCDDYKVRYLCPRETILAAPLAPAQGPKETYRWALTQSEKLCDDYKVCCRV